ncbi:MAG: S41 family peptidase [Bacteroidota bacterium]|nr:S41 family peptidase [Bacteroidota bacterium]
MKLNKKIKIVLIIIPIVLLFGFAYSKKDIYFEIAQNIELFGKIYKDVTFHYVEPIDPSDFMKAAIQGMLSSLDPYTIYMDNSKKNELDLITFGKYGGIGITVGVRGEKIIITEILDGYSAQRQGLRVGDILFEVSGTMLNSGNLDNLSRLVKGEPGTQLELKVLRNDDKDTMDFKLIREEIKVKNIAYAGFYPDNSNNVYIKLTTFSRTAGDELRKALKELRDKKEIKSVILDLRNNPGGLLEVAVDVCEKFIEPNKLIVTTKGRDNNEAKYFSKSAPMARDARLVVLVNEGSASASEIVAGAIQDHDRGVIVGTNSFGKGLVQTITNLTQDASLKITTARYYTPSGRCIQKMDYSLIKNNKKDTSKFYTDNHRSVSAAGGVKPDSTVSFEPEGNITKLLLAEGFIFNFSNHFFSKNSDQSYYSFKNDFIFSEFENFLGQQKFDYHSDAEKQIESLIKEVKGKDLSNEITPDLQKLKTQLQKLSKKETRIFKSEIIDEIRAELVLRYLGQDERIKDQLKYDKQFKVALNIINNNNLYNKFLRAN